jgi:hypothetical protein
MEEHCALCRFYLGNYAASKDDAVGFCRRYPPTISGHYPLVMASGWCGEFQPSASQQAMQAIASSPVWGQPI